MNIFKKLFTKKQIEPKEKTFLNKWNEALASEDEVKLHTLLEEQMESCKSKNSLCGVEIFCPECPMAGFMIECGRALWPE